MKKLSFAFFLVLLGFSVHSQGLSDIVKSNNSKNVTSDELNSNGDRIITTGISPIFRSLYGGGAAGLSCIVSGVDTFFVLRLQLNYTSTPPCINQGCKLILKLSDNSLITLENIYKIGRADYEIVELFNSIEYYVFPGYKVSHNDLRRMIDIGVKKIRIETDSDLQDNSISGNKMSKALSKSLDAIENALRTSKGKSIYSDF
ncbi:MAG: hypothetical protein II975_06410 [Bacteroidales bacterium]|nr:hypothetical protein [Bacteroidales bacterium]